MARDLSLLEPTRPTAIAAAQPTIAHVQLRDLLICPREQGLVNYIVTREIVEQDLHTPNVPPRVLSHLGFTPNSLASLPVGPNGNDTLMAAGGQDKEIYLSCRTPAASSSKSSRASRRTRLDWEISHYLSGSINNSILLTSLSLTRSHESSVEPRVAISNNDGTVKVYDVPLRVQSSARKLQDVGIVKFDLPINHSSISPDGRTLLSVGDSNKIYFHQIGGSGSRITFSPITTLQVPPPDISPLSSSLAASFSTAFSADGSKFAVASQEGVVAVWDVRNIGAPLKVWQTDKTRGMPKSWFPGGGDDDLGSGNGAATGWLSDNPLEWSSGGNKAPGWCARSVKFNGGEGARMGREVMAFTEHTSLVHIVDARTFETHEIVKVPTLLKTSNQPVSSSPLRRPPLSATNIPSTSTVPNSSSTSTTTSNPETSPGPPRPIRLPNSNARTGGPASINGSTRPRISNIRATQRMPIAGSSSVAPGFNAEDGVAVVFDLNEFEAEAEFDPESESDNNNDNSATSRMDVDRDGEDRARERRARVALRGDDRVTTALAERERRRARMALRGDAEGNDHAARIQTLRELRRARRARMALFDDPGRRSSAPSSDPALRTNSNSNGGASNAGNEDNTTNAPAMRSNTNTPSVVQALGDAFRISLASGSDLGASTSSRSQHRPSSSFSSHSSTPPTISSPPQRYSLYSAPSSIGDSTWRTLGGGDDLGSFAIRFRSPLSTGSVPDNVTELGHGSELDADGDADAEGEADDVDAEAHLHVHGEELGGMMENEESYQHRNPNPGRAPNNEGAPQTRDQEDVDDDNIVLIPNLGDREVENEVQAVLAGHGVLSRWSESPSDDGASGSRGYSLGVVRDLGRTDVVEDDDRMDVDAVEHEEVEDGFDLISDRMPLEDDDLYQDSEDESGEDDDLGQTSSRILNSTATRYRARPSASSSHNNLPSSHKNTSLSRPGGPKSVLGKQKRALPAKPLHYLDDLDLAGICFDPLGERMYVAGVFNASRYGQSAIPFQPPPHGISMVGNAGAGTLPKPLPTYGAVVEWGISGAEKRWWVDDGWM